MIRSRSIILFARTLPTIASVAIGIGLSAQNRPLRSDLGMAGGSMVHSANGRSWYMQQAVGQASIAGSFPADGRYFNQGFIQPYLHPVEGLPSTDLDALMYPNPFNGQFMIVLAEEPAEPVMVQVYNPLGQLVYVADHAAQRSIMVQPDPLATGSYVVHVQVGHRRFVAQLQRFE